MTREYIAPWLFVGTWQGFATTWFIVLREDSERFRRHELEHARKWARDWLVQVPIYLLATACEKRV